MTTQEQRGRRKTRIGVVISDKMDKTRVVAVEWSRNHPMYRRPVRKVTKFKAHDANNASHNGDTVRVVETRPLSKDKRWRIAEIVAKGEVVEVAPEEVGASIEQEFGGRKVEEAAAETKQEDSK